jgi:DNA replication protein DnaC
VSGAVRFSCRGCDLILTGQTGTGKTWLACAIGRQAARLGCSVLYVRMPSLFEDLALARLAPHGIQPKLLFKTIEVPVGMQQLQTSAMQ